LIASTDTTKD
jgi:hypothetical protein